MRERSIDIGSLNLSVYEAGEGGRPLLLLHGYGGNKIDFDTVIDPLAERGWHVVAPDHRGHGKSDQPDLEEQYSFEAFTTDAIGLTSELGWDSFALLGHSMGGMVAQNFALVAPRRVRALILMDTSHRNVKIDADAVRAIVSIAREQGMQTVADVMRDITDPLESAAHRRLCDTLPGYAERGDFKLLQCSPAMYAAMALQITEPHDRLTELAEIACPTLVLVGDQDTAFIRPSEAMAGMIPNARLVVIPEAGHSPQYENTDAWFAAVADFLDELPD